MPRTITLSGEPLSTQHIYGNNGRGGRFMTAKARTLKDGYGWEAKAQWKGKPLEGPLYVEVHFYFGSKRKRDLDNHNKITLDSLTGIARLDDSQINELHLFRRFDKKNPRVIVHVVQQLPL